jgi:WS/DGAT/MGAT family acyltransferase
VPAAQLTALDATFLELEEDDQGALMHIGAALVFDPLPGGGTPTIHQVREHVGARLDQLPRYREKLTRPRTGGFAWPSWERDPRFELDAHIRHATLPDPGSERELLDWISDFYSHQLDRSRPLWEIALLDGLAGGGWALVWKTHHCVVDGVGSVGAVNLLLDAEAEAGDRDLPPADGPAARADAHRRSLPRPPSVVRWTGATGLLAARAGSRALLHPREALERSRAIVDLLVRDELIGAPRTSLNQPIGATRRIAAVHAGREQLEAIRAQLGGTLNDVVLYAATSGLRALLLERGEELPRRGLRAMVPVNLRTASDDELGNRVSSMFVELPVTEAEPRRRYEHVRAASEQHKAGGQAQAAGAMVGLTELAPPMLHIGLARMLYATRLFNVTITNVPGPAERVYSFGAPMTDIVPIVPLAADHAVGIAVISYAGRMTFGVIAARASVPELDVLADGVAGSLSELAALVSRPGRTRASGRRSATRG